jgi:putative transposase
VLAALPKSARPGALAAMRDIYNAEDIDKAQVAIKAFEFDYAANYSKAVASPPCARTKVTKGPGSRTAGIAMAYRLIDAAQSRRRAVNARLQAAVRPLGAIGVCIGCGQAVAVVLDNPNET